MLINTVVWALAFIIVKPSYEVTTPFRFLLYRFALASLLAIPIVAYYWQRLRVTWKLLGTIVGIELIGTVLALALVYWGLDLTSTLEANLLVSSMPLFIILGGVILLGERQEKHEWLGLIIALLGTVILIFAPALMNGGGTLLKLSILGNILILSHNIANFFYFPLAKKYYVRVPKLFAASIGFYVGLLAFAILSLLEAGSIVELHSLVAIDLQSPWVWLAVIYMAVFGSIIGLTAYFKGQDGIEASEAALFTYLQPLIYLPVGVLLLKETMGIWQVVGLMLTAGGVYLAERRAHPVPRAIKSKGKTRS